MTAVLNISTYTSRLSCKHNRAGTILRNTFVGVLSPYVIGLLIAIMSLARPADAYCQKSNPAIEVDTIPFFKGFAVSVNISGPIVRALSDYGEYEAALRINLHDEYFPIVEIGYGDCDHYEEVTEISYSTSAPYFRLGCDFNLLKNKHGPNRLYGGVRYGFTSYKVDVSRYDQTDPVWGTETDFIVDGEKCNYHWIEAVVGVSVKIWGPLHLGWNVRYRRRVAKKNITAGKTWYVPGFGKYGDSRLGADFSVILDI